MMETTFKDVIGLYIGCMVQYPDSDGAKKTAVLTGYNVGDKQIETTYKRKRRDGTKGDIIGFKDAKNRGHECYIENVKPILRKLVDITDEDRKEIYHHYDQLDMIYLDECHFTPLQVIQLSSKGYDLFGLIYIGHAIDAATLNTQNK